MQNRWKSPVLWTAILALAVRIAVELMGTKLDDGAIGQMVNLILSALIAFGIVNNPTSKKEI